MDSTISMPTYFIYRDIPPDQPFNSSATLVFVPPKDSDELFDALRAKYPHLKSHSERTREAVIEFLLDEPLMPQSAPSQYSTSEMIDPSLSSPWLESFASMSSEASTWGTPETVDLMTPTFGNSPQPHMQQLTRQTSTVASTAASSPPAMEEMTGVFHLSNSTQQKQRTRRKMTESEKKDYRLRREVKACEKCSKRKRKCTHNQPEVEALAATKTKVEKPRVAAPGKKPVQASLPKIQELDYDFLAHPMGFSQPLGSGDSMQPLEDLGEPFPDLSLDDLLDQQSQWPWNDWTLMDPAFDHSPQSNDPLQQSSLGASFGRSDNNSGNPSQHEMNLDSTSSDFFRSQQEQIHLPQPTHTAHVHDADGIDSFVFETNNPAASMNYDPQEDHALDIVQNRQALRATIASPINELSSRSTVNATGSRSAVNATDSRSAVNAIGHANKKDQSSRSEGSHPITLSSKMLHKRTASSIDQSFATGDGIQLPEKSLPTTSRHQSATEVQPMQPTSHPSNEPQTDDVFRPCNDSLRRQQQHTATQEQMRQTLTLGEGITQRLSPSTELFMLKRRIPKALHSVVDRNNSSTEVNATQVNGGAYLRLDSALDNKPDLSAYASASAEAKQPERWRSRTSTTDRCASAEFLTANQMEHCLTQTSTASTTGSVNTDRRSGIGAFRPLGTDFTRDTYRNLDARSETGEGLAAVASGSSQKANDHNISYSQQERLSDHVRYRDHFGRQDTECELMVRRETREKIMHTIVAFACAVLLTWYLPLQNSSLSYLLLALLTPVSSEKRAFFDKNYRSTSGALSAVVQGLLSLRLVQNVVFAFSAQTEASQRLALSDTCKSEPH